MESVMGDRSSRGRALLPTIIQPTESDAAELTTLLAHGSSEGCLINNEQSTHRVGRFALELPGSESTAYLVLGFSSDLFSPTVTLD